MHSICPSLSARFYQQRDELLVHLTFHLQMQLKEKCLNMVSSMHIMILTCIFRLKIEIQFFTHYKFFEIILGLMQKFHRL